MLEIRIIMNSAVEEIFAFKTCCGVKVFDQNLEILVKNRGDRTVILMSSFDLEGEHATKRIDAVTPPGEHPLVAGEIKALYCYMDETDWASANAIVLYDREGNRYPVKISHQTE